MNRRRYWKTTNEPRSLFGRNFREEEFPRPGAYCKTTNRAHLLLVPGYVGFTVSLLSPPAVPGLFAAALGVSDKPKWKWEL
jgi:hypothetical protein